MKTRQTTMRALTALGAAVAALTTVLVGPAPAEAAITTYISVLTPSGSTGKKVLDIRDWSTADRGQAQLWSLRTSGDVANQRWTITKTATAGGIGVYEIKNVKSGKCLDKSQDTANANGNNVYQVGCSGTSNQRWAWIEVAGGSKWGWLQSQDGGRCLDVRGVSYTDGTPLQVWDCTNNWNQRWNIF